jgi:hypothetical protein
MGEIASNDVFYYISVLIALWKLGCWFHKDPSTGSHTRTDYCSAGSNEDVDMITDHYGRGDCDNPNQIIFGCLISCLLVIIFFSSEAVQAGEKRHHGAHVHGVAHLNVAIEGNNIYIAFISPAANMVGFEHHPRTREQKKAVRAAVDELRNGDSLFLLSTESESRLVRSRAHADIDKDADHHSEPDHAENEHHGEAENRSKAHGQEHEHEHHSEFEAEYHFICRKPDRLAQIDVRLFQVFPGIEHIAVQLLNGTKQTAMELTAKENKISL